MRKKLQMQHWVAYSISILSKLNTTTTNYIFYHNYITFKLINTIFTLDITTTETYHRCYGLHCFLCSCMSLKVYIRLHCSELDYVIAINQAGETYVFLVCHKVLDH